MIKIFKLIIAVLLATIVGVWASSYHGYIMLVLADKTIKMNFVAFIFIIITLFFLLVFCIKFIKLVLYFPYRAFSWLIGIFTVDKQERFTDLIADISLDNNRFIKKLSISNILKLTPNYLKDYLIFRKLSVIVADKDIKELDKTLKQIDNKSISYSFFEAYKLFLVQKFTEAQTKIAILLEKNNIRFMPNIVNLAAKIALADDDDDFALKILEKYDVYLNENLEERLIIFSLRKAGDSVKLNDIYNKSDATERLTRVYLEQLVELGELAMATKIAKKQLVDDNISVEMLELYVNAFSMPISKLYDKVLNRGNHDYDSILALLNLAMLKSDNNSFKMIYDYIERNIKEFLSSTELKKYSHILCKFFIKNGDVAGLDLSEARLVYRDN